MAKRLEQLSLNFDDPTVEETEMHQRMAEEIEINQRYAEYSENEMIEKYREFLQAVRESGINVEDPFKNTITKTRHLKEIMKYDVLYGKGKPVRLKDAKASRIGKAYLKTYNQARKALDD